MKKRSDIFYGWRIVGAGFVTLGVTYGFRYYVFGVFLKPMSAALGWDRTGTAAVYSVSMLFEYALASLVGRIVDRYGPRIVMTIGALVAAAGFASVSLVTELWHYYVLYAIFTTVGVAMMGTVPVYTALANWFTRKRGLTMGLANSAISLGSILLVPCAVWIIDNFGWRIAWLFLGATVLVVITPVAALVMRRRPEDLGLLPDGDAAQAPGRNTLTPLDSAQARPWTLGEAVRTRTFWCLALASGFGSLPVGVYAVHIYSFATDVGVGSMAAAGAISLSSLVAMPGRVFYGWLGDRIDKRHVLHILQTGLCVGFVALILTDSPTRLYIAVVLTGLVLGGSLPVVASLTAELFGRRSMGAVYGLQAFISMCIYSIGPATVGYLYDVTGTYRWGFALMPVSLVIAMILTQLVHAPRRRPVVLSVER